MKAALITGASRGLGEALVVSFLNRGYRAFGLVRTQEAAERLRALDAVPIVGDVSHPGAAAAVRDALEQHTECLDVLVNNAGSGASIRSMQDGVEEELAAHLNVHCIGALRVSRAALPYLQCADAALIVNISSRFGSMKNAAAGLFRGRDLSYAYPVAKAAQNMLTLRMAEELSSGSVQVCGVHPGRMQTASGSPDAIDTAAAAAERLTHWVCSPPGNVHGKFFELDTGKQGW